MTPKMPYTKTNSTKVVTTQDELNVDTPSLVSIRPWTIQGWRPFSVNSQPAVFIMNGAMANQVAAHRNQRDRSRRWRHTAHAPHSASRSTSAPM